MNRRISPDCPLLVATLDIQWDEPEPVNAIGNLERMLRGLSPSFALHECRGPHAYHVFSGDGVRRGRGAGPRRSSRLRRIPVPFDACLALAHLIEHAVIDFQCSVTDGKRCSGLTGAHRSPPGRFDLMIECRDFAVGRCCLALAVVWLTEGAAGHPLGAEERRILRAARIAYQCSGRLLRPPELAALLGIDEVQSHRSLEALRQVGFLTETRSNMNFSGIPEYRVSTARPIPLLPCRDPLSRT